jgi:hypothetical protein
MELTKLAQPPKELTEVERYEYLLQTLSAIATEAGFNMRMTLIEAKYQIGEAIVTGGWYQKGVHGQSKGIIDRIGTDMGVSSRDVYYCIQSYNVAIEHGGLDEWLATLNVGKNLSWSMCKSLLPGKDEEPEDKGGDREKSVKTDRRSAANYTKALIGHIWTQDHQLDLEARLGVHT